MYETDSTSHAPLSTPLPQRHHCCPDPTHQVQDMLNPEYYVGAVQLADGSWVSARFQDQVRQASLRGWSTAAAPCAVQTPASTPTFPARSAPPCRLHRAPCQVSECMPSGAPTKIEERRPLFLIAPPGTADWARPAPATPPEAKPSPSCARGGALECGCGVGPCLGVFAV